MMRRWVGNSLLILGAVIAALMFAEAALRLADVSFPVFYRADEHRGASLRPGAEGWWKQEGRAYVKINRDGLRDRGHIVAKPPDAFRIAVLGDSYAEALQLPMENAFWAVMERELDECPPLRRRDVEVINFGVAGYGTAQELLTLRHHVWEYAPDLVLLAFSTGNDIRNNSRRLESDLMRPYFVLRDDELVLDESFREYPTYKRHRSWMGKALYFAVDHSQVAQLLYEARRSLRARFAPEASGRGALAKAAIEHGLDNLVYLEPSDPAWVEAWIITERILELMRTEVTKRGASLLIVTLTSGIQVHPDPLKRKHFAESLRVETLFYPDRRIKTWGDRNQVSVLNLVYGMQAHAEAGHVYLHGFDDNLGRGHWNANGHLLAGELISREICDQLQGGRIHFR